MSGARVRLEFFVEPFAEGRPGPHVTAAGRVAETRGLDVEVGPFSTVVHGDADQIADVLGDLVSAAIEHGAERVSIQLITPDSEPSIHVGGLQDALVRMIAQVEAELGGPLRGLDREAKQAAVRMLDERGAFLLRKAIEDVADAMGVSRITIYNYLNAIKDTAGTST